MKKGSNPAVRIQIDPIWIFHENFPGKTQERFWKNISGKTMGNTEEILHPDSETDPSRIQFRGTLIHRILLVFNHLKKSFDPVKIFRKNA